MRAERLHHSTSLGLHSNGRVATGRPRLTRPWAARAGTCRTWGRARSNCQEHGDDEEGETELPERGDMPPSGTAASTKSTGTASGAPA